MAVAVTESADITETVEAKAETKIAGRNSKYSGNNENSSSICFI